MTQPTYHRPKRSTIKRRTDFSSRDIYNSFRKERRSKNALKREDYVAILKEFNNRIMKDLIFFNIEFTMPYQMGELSVKKVRQKGVTLDESGKIKSKNLVINYGKTNTLWESDPQAYIERKKIYILNEHSDGYIYRFYWDKIKSNCKYQSYYIFKPIRRYKDYLYNAIMGDRKVDFYEIKARKYYV